MTNLPAEGRGRPRQRSPRVRLSGSWKLRIDGLARAPPGTAKLFRRPGPAPKHAPLPAGYRTAGNEHDAEEVVQDSFLKPPAAGRSSRAPTSAPGSTASRQLLGGPAPGPPIPQDYNRVDDLDARSSNRPCAPGRRGPGRPPGAERRIDRFVAVRADRAQPLERAAFTMPPLEGPVDRRISRPWINTSAQHSVFPRGQGNCARRSPDSGGNREALTGKKN